MCIYWTGDLHNRANGLTDSIRLYFNATFGVISSVNEEEIRMNNGR